MKKATLVTFFFPALLFSQPGIEWQRRLGGSFTEEIYAVVSTRDQGFFIFGYSGSDNGDVTGNHGSGSADFWCVKLDSIGYFEWEKCYGGSHNEWSRGMQYLDDNSFILTGYAQSTDGDVTDIHGGTDAWILNIDFSGQIHWQKCLGGDKNDEAWETQMTNDGGYIMAGWTYSDNGDVTFNHGLTDVWVVKLSADAQIEWQKTYGGSDFDWGYSISQTNDGGYIVCGESQSDDGDVSGNIIGRDAWVIKLDNEGKIEWQKEYGGSAGDRANEIFQTRDGGYIFCGYSESNDGDLDVNFGMLDIWVVKLDSTGNIQWQKAMGGSGQDNGMHIAASPDGGYVVTGSLNSPEYPGNHGSSDLWVIKLSEAGEVLWQRAYGGSLQDYGRSIEPTTDGGYIVGGYTRSAAGSGDVQGVALGSNDFWILKLAPETSSVSQTSAPTEILAWPNPAAEQIWLQLPDATEKWQITITDAAGLALTRTDITPFESIDISNLPHGLLFFSATNQNGQKAVGKFLKIE